MIVLSAYAGQVILCAVVSYLLGSLPTAYWVARAKGINIFEVGSGNMGGTNVARAVGGGWAVLTGLIDVAKGILAVWLARDAILPEEVGLATAVAATGAGVGHNWSLFATLLTASFSEGRLKLILRGGKGAATAFGAMMMIQPMASLTAAAIAVVIIAGTRYVSLGVLVGFGLANIWLTALIAAGRQPPILLLYVVALSLMLALGHRGNIRRLLAGTERRLGERVKG